MAVLGICAEAVCCGMKFEKKRRSGAKEGAKNAHSVEI